MSSQLSEADFAKALRLFNIVSGRGENYSKDDEEEIEDSPELLRDDMCQFGKELHINVDNVEWTIFHKQMAMTYILTGEETKAINHLIESHSAQLRQQVNLRHIKTMTKEKTEEWKSDGNFGLDANYLKFDLYSTDGPDCLREKLKEMPPEWYMIQITKAYEPHKHPSVPVSTHSIHIIVLPTGPDVIPPICITLPKPKNEMYDIARAITTLLDNNKADLRREYETNHQYWSMRATQNANLKTAVNELEKSWLREWRILFIADPIEQSYVSKDLTQMIEKLLADERSSTKISVRTKWLLNKVATCSCYLNQQEIARAVHYLLPDQPKLAKNIVLSIFAKLQFSDSIKLEKRKNLVMIVDEFMDYIPFESMKILRNHPTTRFACLHVASAMLKEHKDTVKNGFKIIKLQDIPGMFIVNPASNLPQMEKRLKTFIDYWLPEWRGIYNEKPNEEQFANALVKNNLLMYNGHGSGIQFLPGERIEKLRVKSTVMLFGCSSLKLYHTGGKFPPWGVSNQYITACSPCLLGMLWEVTDLGTDKLTAQFITKWIPSVAKYPWSDVSMEKWSEGKLAFKKKTKKLPDHHEPEMLRAIAYAKAEGDQFMNSAAVIVRGLPIKIEY